MTDIEICKQRMLQFWGEEDIVKLPTDEALAMGFKTPDADFFCKIGLPSWAAPNIWIHTPFKRDGLIVFGEDRDDSKLVYDPNNGAVYAMRENSTTQFVSSNLEYFLCILLAYAEMVEKAIQEKGPTAFLKNNISCKLVDVFESDIAKFVRDDVGNSTLWTAEIARLRDRTESAS